MFRLNFVPGPGTYEMLSATSPKGNHFLSKFESSRASLFNPPHSKRFQGMRKSRRLYMFLAKQIKQFPGPGQYPPAQTISKTGTYFISKFKSSQCRTFGLEFRETLESRGDFATSPGPGTYRSPSDFGYYEAQPKFVEETKRVERILMTPKLKNGRQLGRRSIATSQMTRSKSQPSITKGENRSTEIESTKDQAQKKASK